MSDNREKCKIVDIIEPEWVREGAGVKLRRSIGGSRLDHIDPFLLLDHFGSHNPADYERGFPMHPHRGIETVTYMLAGLVRHTDSMGNSGEITSGDVQWMTAGRAILHEEMPEGLGGHMEGFQLWVNLPASLKMSPPRYQEVNAAQIPWLNPSKGVLIRLIAGTMAMRVDQSPKSRLTRLTWMWRCTAATGLCMISRSVTTPSRIYSTAGANFVALQSNRHAWLS